MRILFTTTAPTLMRFFESVVAELATRGHEVHIARHLPASKSRHDHVADRLSETYPAVTRGEVPAPDPLMHPFALALRSARDYVQFLDPAYNASYRLRAERRVPGATVRLLGGPLGRSARLRGVAASILDTLSTAVPVDRNLTRFLTEGGYDVVLMTPYMGLKTPQPDLARAAQALGIPAVVCVASWDNLSSKSRVWPAPDVMTVWNEIQRGEAVDLHGIDPDTVAVTGAQVFDQWFERRPRPREEFLAKVGLPADRPVVLYLCSSPFRDAPPELPYVRSWIEALRASDDPALAGASVLVRPHPKRAEEWEGVDLAAEMDRVAVWPRHGALVIDEEASADYFDSLFHSEAVVGLNTSAMIEAGIVGRPVHTILVPEFEQSQQGTFHFRYLVDVGGGLVRVGHDLAEHHRQLAESLAHAGEQDAAAEGFVRAFVRPYGLDVAATPRFADAIEAAGSRERALGRPRAAGRAALRPVVVVGAHARARVAAASKKRRRRRLAAAR